MKHLPSLFALSLLLIGCPGGTGLDDDDDDAPDEPTWVELPDAIADAFRDEAAGFDAPGAAIAIRHGDILYAGTYGTKDPDGGDAVAPTTLFRIGSTTKMMTATALLQQVDAGLLALDDSLEDHVPGLGLTGVAEVDDITLHHLISHTAGLSELTPIDDGAEDERLASFSATLASQIYLMSPPGEFWNYSNPNFSLAGLVVEETDGRFYREVMRTEVFEPLGMDRTMFLGEEVLEDGDYAVAWGRGWTQAEPGPLRIEPDAYDDAWSRPAGFAWSSVLELVTFGDFLLDGHPDVLSPALHDELVSAQTPTAAFLDRLDYGYGTMLWSGGRAGSDWYDVDTLEHNGAIPGYSAEIWTVPSADLVVAALGSTDGTYFSETRAVILETLLGEAPTSWPDLEVAEDFGRYAGTYQDDFTVGTLTITVDAEGQLVIDAPALDAGGVPYAATLAPSSRDNFTWVLYGTYPLTVTFLPAADGDPEVPVWFRTRSFVAARAEPEPDGRSMPDASRLRETLMASELLR